MKKRAVLVLLTDPFTGGGFQYTLNLLKAFESLDEARYERSIISRSSTWNELADTGRIPMHTYSVTLAERILRKLSFLLPLGRMFWRTIGWYFSSIERRLQATSPDVVIYSAAEPVALSFRFPTVVPVHDLMHRYEPSFPEVSNPKSFRSREFVNSTLCAWSAAVLVDSRVGKDQLIESYGISADRVFDLPYTVPPYIQDSEKSPDPEVIERYGLPDRFLLYPAQFWKHKNHVRLITAIGLLKARGLTVNIVLCGSEKNSGTEITEELKRQGVEQQVWNLKYVPNDELIALYRKALGLVMPTFFGPTNIPPLEAFALGCPVIVSDIYGMREQLGDAALYFDPLNVQDLALRIEELVTNDHLRASLISKGAERSKTWTQTHFNGRFSQIIEAVTRT
jgi:glycosyltransferase involved in cell wall biosynthesis